MVVIIAVIDRMMSNDVALIACGIMAPGGGIMSAGRRRSICCDIGSRGRKTGVVQA